MDINELKQHINKKSRLIGVDMGSKRVGLSISDENRKISTPLKTINYENIHLLIVEIEKIINKNNIGGIVFGNPKNMDGTDGSSSQSVASHIIEPSGHSVIPSPPQIPHSSNSKVEPH